MNKWDKSALERLAQSNKSKAAEDFKAQPGGMYKIDPKDDKGYFEFDPYWNKGFWDTFNYFNKKGTMERQQKIDEIRVTLDVTYGLRHIEVKMGADWVEFQEIERKMKHRMSGTYFDTAPVGVLVKKLVGTIRSEEVKEVEKELSWAEKWAEEHA